jgi:hypothetical protein
MTKIVELDDYRFLHELIENRFKSKKFALGIYLEDGNLATYFDDDLTDLELCYLIQTLQDRRNAKFNRDT